MASEIATQATPNEELQCPITQEIPEDPVLLTVDGRIYSKKALLHWLRTNSSSPYNRAPCSIEDISECIAVRNLCALARDGKLTLTSVQAVQSAPFVVAPGHSKVPISKTGNICCYPAAFRTDESKLLLSLNCTTPSGLIETPSDLGWSDIMIVLDQSYSTTEPVEARDSTGEKMETDYCINDLIRHTSKAIAASVRGTGSRVGFCSFDNAVYEVASLTAITPDNQDQVLEKIDAIKPTGGTNIWKGCRHAVKTLMTRENTSRNPAIILLTDGRPTDGTNKPENEAIVQLFDNPPQDWNCNASGHIPIYSIGFGYSLQKDLMYNIARDTGGVNSSIPGGEMMATVFSNAVANILNTRCYSSMLHISIPERGLFELGRGGMEKKLVECGLPTSTINHPDGSIELQICIGSLQFEQSRELVLNLRPLVPNATLNYWVSYYQGGERCETSRGSILDIASLGEMHPRADFELLRDYACQLLRTMIQDRNMNMAMNCTHRYENFLGRLRNLDEHARNSEDVARLEATWTDQVRLAIVSQDAAHSDYWNRWGWIYIDQLISALSNQCSTNFKDETLKSFGGQLLAATSDKVSEIFDDLPNTPATGHNYSHNSRQRAARPNRATATPSVSHYNQSSYGTVCFTAETLLRLANGTTCLSFGMVRAGDIVEAALVHDDGTVGDIVSATVIAVVETICPQGETNLVELSDFCEATPWHPVCFGGAPSCCCWGPAREFGAVRRRRCASVFNLVLDRGAAIVLPDRPHSHLGTVLGHGVKCSKLAHPFWGTSAVVTALKKLPGYPHVKIHPSMIKREGAVQDWGREVSDIRAD